MVLIAERAEQDGLVLRNRFFSLAEKSGAVFFSISQSRIGLFLEELRGNFLHDIYTSDDTYIYIYDIYIYTSDIYDWHTQSGSC